MVFIGILIVFVVFVLLTMSEFSEGYQDAALTAANSIDPSIAVSSPTYQYSSDPNSNYLSSIENQFNNTYGNGAANSTPSNFDPSNNLVDPPAIYYQPGSFMYPGTGYVPNNESLFINPLTNLPEFGLVQNTPYLSGGFCQTFANDVYGLEQKCNSLSSDVCASTECCALLGGQMCVAGNAQGPTLQSNYSNFLIQNRDMYYYQGNCYGNCPNNNV
jgi:hypothetical protein